MSGRLTAQQVRHSIRAEGCVIVLLAYDDGTVALSSDDKLPPAIVAEALRDAAGTVDRHPGGNA